MLVKKADNSVVFDGCISDSSGIFLAAARSRCGSDMPPACHSLPHRRFATPSHSPCCALDFAPLHRIYPGSLTDRKPWKALLSTVFPCLRYEAYCHALPCLAHKAQLLRRRLGVLCGERVACRVRYTAPDLRKFLVVEYGVSQINHPPHYMLFLAMR